MFESQTDKVGYPRQQSRQFPSFFLFFFTKLWTGQWRNGSLLVHLLSWISRPCDLRDLVHVNMTVNSMYTNQETLGIRDEQCHKTYTKLGRMRCTSSEGFTFFPSEKVSPFSASYIRSRRFVV